MNFNSISTSQPLLRLCRAALMVMVLIFNSPLAAQDVIEGKVVDDGSTQPMAHANIFLLSAQNQGVISNELGQFRLKISDEHASDTLVVSVVGYEVEMRPIASASTPLTIRLRRNTLLLDEVTVTFKEKVHKLLRKAINRIPQNYGTRKFLAKGYYQEYSIKDTSYVEFIESFVNIADRRFVSAKDQSFIHVEQMRRICDERQLPEEVQRFFAFNRIYTIYERMNNVRQRQFFALDQKPHSGSTYRIEHYREYAEEADTLIEIGYRTELSHKDAVGYRKSSGTIVLRKSDLAILKMSRGSESDLTYHEVSYRKLGDKYFPNRISYKYGVEDDEGTSYAVSRVLCIYEIVPERARAKGVRLERTQDVRDLKYKYDPQFWEDNQVLMQVPAPSALKADLMRRGGLERQFRKNEKGS